MPAPPQSVTALNVGGHNLFPLSGQETQHSDQGSADITVLKFRYTVEHVIVLNINLHFLIRVLAL